MKCKKIICTAILTTSILMGALAQNDSQKGRAIGRGYSKKLLDQEKYFDDLKKPNGEKYGNKELAVEIAVGKMVDINIEINNRSIEIKTWDEPKIKIVANVYYDGSFTKLGSDAWFEKLKISTKLLGNSLRVKADALNYSVNGNSNSQNFNSDGVEVYSVDGQYIRTEPVKRKVVIIYLPKDNKTNLDIKYADVAVVDYCKKLNVDITNGSLQLDNVNNLTLRSKYTNVTVNEIEQGEIDFVNGRLSIGNIGEVELDTKYSTVEIGSTKKLVFKSTNDDYDLDQVNSIEGSKNYGSFRISKLSESIQIDGTNADIKVKQVEPSVKFVNIDNKYADIRLPLRAIKNFSLYYDGTYSTIYKTFKIFDNEENRITTGDAQNSKYNATIGNGVDTKISMHCTNCTVDFK
jgi:hypothetical protein